jgi:hypothetical protein
VRCFECDLFFKSSQSHRKSRSWASFKLIAIISEKKNKKTKACRKMKIDKFSEMRTSSAKFDVFL